jgi:hypothetical protein
MALPRLTAVSCANKPVMALPAGMSLKARESIEVLADIKPTLLPLLLYVVVA